MPASDRRVLNKKRQRTGAVQKLAQISGGLDNAERMECADLSALWVGRVPQGSAVGGKNAAVPVTIQSVAVSLPGFLPQNRLRLPTHSLLICEICEICG